MTKEKRDKGTVRLATYWYYISRGWPIVYLMMLLVVLGSQALLTYSALWLSQWGSAAYLGLTSQDNMWYLGRYAIFVVCGAFSTLVNMMLNLESRTKAAKVIIRSLARWCCSSAHPPSPSPLPSDYPQGTDYLGPER